MKLGLVSIALLLGATVFAQDTKTLLQEATNLEKQFKEEEALGKFVQVAAADPSNTTVLVKCAELECSIGARQTDKSAKSAYYSIAKAYADKALAADSNNANGYYAQALVYGKLTETEDDKKKLVEDVRQVYANAKRSLALNPNHARANYVFGRWNLEMLDLNWFKKAALKTMYGGLPGADIDTAIIYMEKCKTLEPYFVRNYFDLAKAYQFKNRPAQAIDVLNRMVKLPTRTADDAALKAEGKKLLDSMQ